LTRYEKKVIFGYVGTKITIDMTELGRAGGRARADRMTAEERSDAARLAVQARWAKTPRKPEARKRKKAA
jgi:hypothetical protein